MRNREINKNYDEKNAKGNKIMQIVYSRTLTCKAYWCMKLGKWLGAWKFEDNYFEFIVQPLIVIVSKSNFKAFFLPGEYNKNTNS